MATMANQSDQPTTYGEVVREHGRTQPDTVAFAFGDEDLTFGALDSGSNRAAQGLLALGIRKGDRIAYLGKNHPLYFELLIAAMKIGAVMTPVNWRLAAPEVEYILEDSWAKAVFAGEGFLEQAQAIGSRLGRVTRIIGVDAPGAATDYRTWREP